MGTYTAIPLAISWVAGNSGSETKRAVGVAVCCLYLLLVDTWAEAHITRCSTQLDMQCRSSGRTYIPRQMPQSTPVALPSAVASLFGLFFSLRRCRCLSESLMHSEISARALLVLAIDLIPLRTPIELPDSDTRFEDIFHILEQIPRGQHA